MDLVTHGPPALHGTIEPETLDALDQRVKRNPAHHLGVDEVLPLPARLPDPVVRSHPGLLQAPCEPALQLPTPLHRDDPRGPTHVRGGEHLAWYVALDLACGVVAYSHRRGAFVAGEPGQFVLGQAAGAVDAVHDLEVGGVAGDGP